MKSNSELLKDVQDALKWEPLLNAAEIGVIVKDGVVTLTGAVDSYSQKIEAEEAAKNVSGVKVVVEKMEIKISYNSAGKNDNEIASEVVYALKQNWHIPDDKVKVKVEKGWVTLDGELQWNYQREVVKTAVKNLSGVLGVSNNITTKPETLELLEQKDIESALKRHWSIEKNDINVAVSGHKVTLTGKVVSWYQKDEAARIAWKAPGVLMVDNELTVEYDHSLVN